MKPLLYFTVLTFFLSCSSTEQQDPLDQSIIEELEDEGFEYTGETDKTPGGISATEMIGYTDRVDGIFHEKREEFSSLRIDGFEFVEATDAQYKQKLVIYRFEFDDPDEKKRFENFQPLIINYQTHSKCQVEFFERESTWFLKFAPMP